MQGYLRDVLYRIVISLLLVASSPTAFGQTCAFPVIDNSWRFDAPLELDYTGKIQQSYTEVVLEPMGDKAVDTAALLRMEFSAGRLLQSEVFSYAGKFKRQEIALRYGTIPSMALYGVRSVFRRDSSQTLHQFDTTVYPAGSAGLFQYLSQSWFARQYAAGRRDPDSVNQDHAYFLDSMQGNPPMAMLKPSDSASTAYDQHGNPLRRFARRGKQTINEAYAYTSGSNGLKQVQRIRKLGGVDSYLEEHEVTFEAPCRISSIISYVVPLSGEADIRQDIFLKRAERRYYAGGRLTKRIATLVYPERQQRIRHVTRYTADEKERDILVLDSSGTGRSRDTLNYARFGYDDRGQLLQVFQQQHSKYSVGRYRDELRYDASGRLIEIRTYLLGQRSDETPHLMRQRLLFYGAPSDRQTAALRLLHQPPSSKQTDTTRPQPGVYKFAEKMPEFNGNIQVWLNAHLQYPADARAEGIGGRVIAGFIVGQDGTIRDVKIVRGVHPGCDQEVLRVIGMMPPWIPGRQNGHPVDVYTTLPVTFVSQ